jgi:hypothetical protein
MCGLLGMVSLIGMTKLALVAIDDMLAVGLDKE